MKYLKKENTLEKRIRLDQKVIHAIESIAFKKGESFSLAINKILEIHKKKIFCSLISFIVNILT